MAPPEKTYILSGWLLDGGGRPPLERAWLEIEGDSIGRLGRGPVPDRGRIIDLSDCTLIPGLIDAHVHLHMSGSADPQLRDIQNRCGFSRSSQLIDAHARAQLAGGVAAVRDGGDYGGYVARYRAEKGFDRLIVHSPGKAWRAQGRYGKLIGRPPEPGQSLARAVADCPDEVDHLKVVNSGINSLKVFGRQTAPQFPEDELRAAFDLAHGRGLKVMVHANGVEPVGQAVRAGADTIEHGFFMDRACLELMAERGCAWTPTVGTMAGYAALLPEGAPEADLARRILEAQLDLIVQGIRAGVTILAGTDCGSLGVDHGRALGRELGLLMAAGLDPARALACAAARPARLMGLADELGRLSPGLAAHFIALPGRPEELARNLNSPRAIWFNGRPLKEAETATG